jgi:hypothetical protein
MIILIASNNAFAIQDKLIWFETAPQIFFPH